MSDASGTLSLSVDDVVKIIGKVKAGTTDPISMGLAIFSCLGDNAIISGDTLRQALSQAALPLDGPLAVVVTAVQSITKAGSLITLTNNQELRPTLQGTTLRLSEKVTFQIGSDSDFPSISNIVGVAVHKILWIDIQQIQLRQQGGQRTVHVATSHGSRNFVLP
jgi:hypothetical protein